ncbi:GAF domain-containing protein [Arthrobacter ulcerisalmonis]|uniref:GAF and ANTAR domain-containing protein n=1 Tax=Arthrobacter sp. B1I2 TaxID=3042263 RepID=UPI00277ED035|nr:MULTISPECIES: GAF and ANTAR domain-containing protein [Arthrobacter]MDQ0661879.1 GAF domain-containing protein [Arthrobacter ulcerisalmonis]MDQ0729795.1 GAF domain-containing protein [Arthrobacter sp. B1I2]
MGTLQSDDQFVQLHDLIIGSSNVADFLTELSTVAASTLTDAAGVFIECGVTLRRRKRSTTIAGSSERAVVLDQLEQVLGDGPCIAALDAMKPMVLSNVGTDNRWPDYRKVLADNGCRSALGVPLVLDEHQSAALNFFAAEPDIFAPDVIRKAEGFAELAGRALRLSLRIADARNLADDLTAAMANRTTIDLACGVIMAQNRCSQDEAIAMLTKASSHRNQKLRDLAAGIIGRVSDGGVTTHFDP